MSKKKIKAWLVEAEEPEDCSIHLTIEAAEEEANKMEPCGCCSGCSCGSVVRPVEVTFLD